MVVADNGDDQRVYIRQKNWPPHPGTDERRHPVAGSIATDLCRRAERWLIDVGLESSISDGSTMATRLLIDDLPRHMQGQPLEAIVDDRSLAETIYRIALANGLTDRIEYRDLPADTER